VVFFESVAPEQGLLHPEVWIFPTWASALDPQMHVLNLYFNSLTMHMYPLIPLTMYHKSHMWCDTNVWTHHSQPVEVQNPPHVDHVEHVSYFP
jgi:hypothetical protein